MTGISKGAKLAFGMLGITPEMLANPQLLLKRFGIDPDLVFKEVAKFEQIGLRIERAFVDNATRLARIEAHLGITDPGIDNGADEGAGDQLGNVGLIPPDRRN